MSGRPVSERIGQEMEWVRVGFWNPGWELRAGSEVLATIVRRSLWLARMRATVDGASYRFTPDWNGHIRADLDRDAVADSHEAPRLRYVRLGWRRDEADKGARLSVSRRQGRFVRGGEVVAWLRHPSLFGRDYEVVNANGEVLIDLKASSSLIRSRSPIHVTIAKRASELPDLSLLFTLASWAVFRERRPRHH